MSNKRLIQLLENRGGGRCKTEISWTATIKQYSEEFLVQ